MGPLTLHRRQQIARLGLGEARHVKRFSLATAHGASDCLTPLRRVNSQRRGWGSRNVAKFRLTFSAVSRSEHREDRSHSSFAILLFGGLLVGSSAHSSTPRRTQSRCSRDQWRQTGGQGTLDSEGSTPAVSIRQTSCHDPRLRRLRVGPIVYGCWHVPQCLLRRSGSARGIGRGEMESKRGTHARRYP